MSLCIMGTRCQPRLLVIQLPKKTKKLRESGCEIEIKTKKTKKNTLLKVMMIDLRNSIPVDMAPQEVEEYLKT